MYIYMKTVIKTVTLVKIDTPKSFFVADRLHTEPYDAVAVFLTPINCRPNATYDGNLLKDYFQSLTCYIDYRPGSD